MYRRAEIVVESGQRQLHGARAASGLRLGFEDLDLQARLRQHNRRRQSIRARADNARLASCKSRCCVRRSAQAAFFLRVGFFSESRSCSTRLCSSSLAFFNSARCFGVEIATGTVDVKGQHAHARARPFRRDLWRCQRACNDGGALVKQSFWRVGGFRMYFRRPLAARCSFLFVCHGSLQIDRCRGLAMRR